jgi:hypothetical protein
MTPVTELLNEARAIIDGECDSTTPEYRALSALEYAVGRLANAVKDLEVNLERLQGQV